MNKRIKQFITKNYNQVEDAYCWINSNKKLSKEELIDLEQYFKSKTRFNFMIIINGCQELRPQRKWFELPEFFKGTDGSHKIYKSDSNAFILCSWLEPYDDYKDHIETLVSSIPSYMEVITFMKKESE